MPILVRRAAALHPVPEGRTPKAASALECARRAQSSAHSMLAGQPRGDGRRLVGLPVVPQPIQRGLDLRGRKRGTVGDERPLLGVGGCGSCMRPQAVCELGAGSGSAGSRARSGRWSSPSLSGGGSLFPGLPEVGLCGVGAFVGRASPAAALPSGTFPLPTFPLPTFPLPTSPLPSPGCSPDFRPAFSPDFRPAFPPGIVLRVSDPAGPLLTPDVVSVEEQIVTVPCGQARRHHGVNGLPCGVAARRPCTSGPPPTTHDTRAAERPVTFHALVGHPRLDVRSVGADADPRPDHNVGHTRGWRCAQPRTVDRVELHRRASRASGYILAATNASKSAARTRG